MSKSRLYSAKSEYIKKIETLLPLWRQLQMDELEKEMKNIKLEKDAVNVRRMRLAIEAEREDKVKDLLENERKELLFSLAKEQSEIIELNNKDVKRRENADRFDRLITSEMNAVASPKTNIEATPPVHKPPKLITVSNTVAAKNDKKLPDISVSEEEFEVSIDEAINPPLPITTESKVQVHSEVVEERSDSPVIIGTPSREASTSNDGILLIGAELSIQNIDNNEIDMPSSTTSSAKLIRTNSNRSPSSKTSSPGKLLKEIPSSARSLSDENSSTSTSAAIDNILTSSSLDSSVRGSEAVNDDANQASISNDNSEEIAGLVRSYNLQDCVQIVTSIALKLENFFSFCEKNQSIDSIPYIKPLDLQTLSVSILQSIINDSLRGTSTNVVDGSNLNYFTTLIQLILRTKGADLIPFDVFNGLVTVDKLKKELKRLGIGRIELWNATFSHMGNILKILTKIVFRNANLVQELANNLCETLLYSMTEGDDKHRIRRKLVNLIQLLILPDINSSGELGSSGGRTANPPPVPPKPTPPKPSKINKSNFAYDKIGVNISKLSTLGGGNADHADLDDDEIIDEETIAGPPLLRDLAPENGVTAATSAVAKPKEVVVKKGPKAAPNRADESDEFEFF